MAEQLPKKARQPHFVFWYAIIGFLFGILCIVLATFIALRDAQLAFTLANAVKVHFTNPLLWFFDLAPFVFAILLGFAGRGENRFVRERQTSALNVQKNSEKLTAEIYALKDQIRDLEKWSHSLDESLKSEKDSNVTLQRSLADLQLSSKSTEDLISRAKQHWETTFDSVEDMILLANTDGVILRCNKATAEAFKTDYTRMIGMPVSSMIGSEANSPDSILSPGQRKEIKILPLERWYEVTASPLELEDQQSGYIYIFRDITERRQAAHNLQLQKQYYESLVKNNPVAIATLKMDHTVVECNPAFEKLFGFSPGEVLGKDLGSLIAPEGFDGEMQRFADAACQGEQAHAVTRCKRKDDTLVDVEYFWTPLFSYGRQVGTLAFYHDITELRRDWEAAAAAKVAASQVIMEEEKVEPIASKTVEEEKVEPVSLETVEEEKIEPVALKTGKAGVNIEKIEGIGPSYAQRLALVGITNTGDLLRLGASRKGREDLAEQTGLSGKLILAWVNRADLMRVPGIGEEYSDLLELAGVDTVKELRRRSPENLYQKMQEVNEQRPVVRRVPSLSEVSAWIEAASEIEALLTY
jgi:PAS domain S-box-containing protein